MEVSALLTLLYIEKISFSIYFHIYVSGENGADNSYILLLRKENKKGWRKRKKRKERGKNIQNTLIKKNTEGTMILYA